MSVHLKGGENAQLDVIYVIIDGIYLLQMGFFALKQQGEAQEEKEMLLSQNSESLQDIPEVGVGH